jgi:hypothetical protein
VLVTIASQLALYTRLNSNAQRIDGRRRLQSVLQRRCESGLIVSACGRRAAALRSTRSTSQGGECLIVQWTNYGTESHLNSAGHRVHLWLPRVVACAAKRGTVARAGGTW